MQKEYDIYKEYEKIYLEGSLNDKTNFDIYIEEMDRRVTAKIPNTIKPYDKIKLSGLGKKKNDNKYGDLYISFKRVFLELDNNYSLEENENRYITKPQKYEYKYIQRITFIDIDEIIQDCAENGWRCVSVEPIITRLASSEGYDDNIEYTPDYEFNLLFERKI